MLKAVLGGTAGSCLKHAQLVKSWLIVADVLQCRPATETRKQQHPFCLRWLVDSERQGHTGPTCSVAGSVLRLGPDETIRIKATFADPCPGRHSGGP